MARSQDSERYELTEGEKRDDEELGFDTGGRQVKGWTACDRRESD